MDKTVIEISKDGLFYQHGTLDAFPQRYWRLPAQHILYLPAVYLQRIEQARRITSPADRRRSPTQDGLR